MADDLTEQISEFQKNHWILRPVNLQGLIDCSTAYLSSAAPGPGPSCLSISFLGRGSYNTVYKLVFSDGTRLAASLSNREEEYFYVKGKLSEIETMKFVRDSGLYPDIPVPRVHTWDTTFSNPVGTPYVLMDDVEGENLNNLRDNSDLFGFDTLPLAQQLSVVKALAKLQASLSRPVPFDKIGSITPDATGGHFVGPLINLTQQSLGGPFKSVDELWRSSLEEIMLDMVQVCHFDLEAGSEDDSEDDSEDEDDDEFLEAPVDPNQTPHAFAEIFQLLHSLIPHFTIPHACSRLVLHHPDLALRNIFFDKESLSSGEAKITGVIDWGGAQIIPLMLTAQYPGDLMSTADEPLTRSRYPGDTWDFIPFDWTSAGDPARYPKVFRGRDGNPVDFASVVAAKVGRFYLRAYFSACYAEQLHLLYGDTDLARATLFADAPYYLKFHETICGSLGAWLEHADWIRETYWRLRCLTERRQGGGGESLIVGPNMYRNSMQPMLRDTGIFEELPCSENAAL